MLGFCVPFEIWQFCCIIFTTITRMSDPNMNDFFTVFHDKVPTFTRISDTSWPASVCCFSCLGYVALKSQLLQWYFTFTPSTIVFLCCRSIFRKLIKDRGFWPGTQTVVAWAGQSSAKLIRNQIEHPSYLRLLQFSKIMCSHINSFIFVWKIIW